MSVRYTTILVLIAILSLSASAVAHHSHASLTEIEWNSKSQRFEVAMRLRIADLEDAVSSQLKTRFRIEGTPHREKLIQAYLAKHFSVLFEGHKVCRLHWIGCELELHEVWLYFEAESIAGSELEGQAKVEPPLKSNRVERWHDLFVDSVPTPQAVVQRSSNSAVMVRNTALMNVQPEQVNVIALTRDRDVKTVILTHSQSVREFRSP